MMLVDRFNREMEVIWVLGPQLLNIVVSLVMIQHNDRYVFFS